MPEPTRLDESGRRQIARNDAALTRVGAGSDDRSSSCGEPIRAERVEALPSASACVDCASSEGETTSSPG
jgi:RNA polymerase-binding transcription factor DksA